MLARAARAREMLRSCEMCELRCGADRVRGERAPCGLGAETYSFKRHVSYAEEVELLPSYMVYFAGCNFRCSFCVQAPTCFNPRAGELVNAAELAAEFARIVDRGARTINLLGGEPSLHLHTILEIAAAAWPRRLPLLLNSNFYMSSRVLEMLNGVIEISLADLKFGNDTCAAAIAKIPNYFASVTRNLLAAGAMSTLMVRYLTMPGHNECCLRPVAKWIATNAPECRFTLMTGYVPAWQARDFDRGSLSRLADRAEVAQALAITREFGLRTEEHV